MVITSNSDIYAAIHDQGINRVVKHIARQRPSLFNYGTERVQRNLNLLCVPIEASPDVTQFITIQDPLPVFGSENLILDFCFQLSDLQIDFHPGNVISLPSELNPPLAEQHFAIRAQVCGGINCIPRKVLDTIPRSEIDFGKIGVIRRRKDLIARSSRSEVENLGSSSFTNSLTEKRGRFQPQLFRSGILRVPDISRRFPGLGGILIPTEKLECFCIELFATGTAKIEGPVGEQEFRLKVDGIEIVDIDPKGLENIIECYSLLVLEMVVLPQAGAAVSEMLFNQIDLGDTGELTISASTTVPNNPAIEEDQLKSFIDLERIILTPGDGGGGGGGGLPPSVSRSTRSRSRSGPNDMTTALSEAAFQQIFAALKENFTFSRSDSGNFGPLVAGYSVSLSLENGTVEFRDDNKIHIEELDIKWDTLQANLGIDIDEICVGGFCIIPNLSGGCAVRAPRICVFSGSPDINLNLDLSSIFTSEITMTASPKIFYGEGTPNRWQIFIDPTLATDLDIIDIADTIGDILEAGVDAAIDGLLGPLPDWAKDVVRARMGPAIDLIRDILDIPDDIGEWFADLIGVNLGLWNFIKAAVIDYLANQQPIFELEDPFTAMPADGPLIPVRIPIEFLGVRVNSDEMVMEGDVGEP